MHKDILCKWECKKAGLAIFKADEIGFKTKSIAELKKDPAILLLGI